MAPAEGFRRAFQAGDRRAQAGLNAGAYPYVLGALGGAAWFVLLLKVRVIAGFTQVCPGDFKIGYLFTSLVLGGLLGLAAQAVWGLGGRRALPATDGGRVARNLRLVWGGASLPVALSLLLLPLDLLIVGSETFTSQALTDSVDTAWAALSVAVTVALAAWSLWLLFRGGAVAGELDTKKAVLFVLAGIALLVVVFGGFVLAATAASEGGACLTPQG